MNNTEKVCEIVNGKIIAVNVSLYKVIKEWLRDFAKRKIRFS